MLLLLSNLAVADRPSQMDAPAQAVRAYLDAGDTHDVSALKRTTHADFRVVARMPDGLSVLDRDTYVSLIEAKKIGGSPRASSFTAVLNSGDLATVKGTLSSAAAHFDSTWTLARTDEGWKVVQDPTVFAPK